MTPRERSTAEMQLERILHILPAAARADGVRVADLARELDVEQHRILDDLAEATNRSFHHPGGAVEPFSIFVTRGRVFVNAAEHFRRPVRLSEREALALGLGLRVLAADAVSDERRGHVVELAARLEAALPPDADGTAVADNRDGVEYDVDEFGISVGDDRFRGTFAEAIERRVVCSFTYLKAGGDAPVLRRVAPYRLVYASGRWYVAGLDIDRQGLRFFRLDRVLDACATSDAAPAEPAHFADWVAGAPYSSEEEEEVTVVYHPPVASWVCEACGIAPEADGSVMLRHRVADRRWLVRHVLQYGGAATVAAPAEVRASVAAAAAVVGELRSSPQ